VYWDGPDPAGTSCTKKVVAPDTRGTVVDAWPRPVESVVSVPPLAADCGHEPGTCCMNTPYVVFGEPACNWIFASNEPGVSLSTTNPTELAASLVFVVQSPWDGSFVPNATLSPAAGTVTAGEAAVVDGSETDVDAGVDVAL